MQNNPLSISPVAGARFQPYARRGPLKPINKPGAGKRRPRVCGGNLEPYFFTATYFIYGCLLPEIVPK